MLCRHAVLAGRQHTRGPVGIDRLVSDRSKSDGSSQCTLDCPFIVFGLRGDGGTASSQILLRTVLRVAAGAESWFRLSFDELRKDPTTG